MISGAMGSELAKRRPSVNIKQRARLISSEAINEQMTEFNQKTNKKNPTVRFASTKFVNTMTLSSPTSNDDKSLQFCNPLIKARAFHPFSGKGRKHSNNN